MQTAGIEWVNKYNGFTTDLKHNAENVTGFVSALRVTPLFDNGDDHAVDEHLELPANAGTGDHCLADVADIVYFSGHGNINGAIFGKIDRDDGFATPDRIKLGRLNCKWLVVDACEVLQKSAGSNAWYRRLSRMFAGLHYIFGFDTRASDSAGRGRLFAERLTDGLSVREAWIRACTETEEPRRTLAYMRIGRVDGVDTLHDRWTTSGPAAAPAVPGEQPAGRFLYFRTGC